MNIVLKCLENRFSADTDHNSLFILRKKTKGRFIIRLDIINKGKTRYQYKEEDWYNDKYKETVIRRTNIRRLIKLNRNEGESRNNWIRF